MSGSPIPAFATSRICEATSARTTPRASSACRAGARSFIGDRIAKERETSMKVYGIANCTTVKGARAWLDRRKIAYEFVDFKKAPPTRDILERWCKTFGW